MRKFIRVIMIGVVMLIPVALLSLYTIRALQNESSKNSGNTAKLKFVSPVAIIDEISAKLEEDEVEDANILINSSLPDPNIPSSKGTPLVVFAAERGYLDIVANLVQKGADPNKADLNTSETALIKAVRNKDYPMVQQVLLPAGVNPNLSTNQGLTPLGIAISLKDKAMADLLIASGALNGISAENLILYAFQKNAVGVETMLSGGVAPDSKDKDNNTPLIIAAANGDLDSAKQLIAYHATVNIKNNVGMTPLLYAVKGKHKEMAEYLINNGARINASNIYGQNALFWAAYNGDSKLVHNLLMLGANYQKKTRRNQTALQMAKALGHTETVKMLEDYIAYRNLPRDSKGNIILPQVNKAQATQNNYGLPAGLVNEGTGVDVGAGVMAGINKAQTAQTVQSTQTVQAAQVIQEGQLPPAGQTVQSTQTIQGGQPAPVMQPKQNTTQPVTATPQTTPAAQTGTSQDIDKIMAAQLEDDSYEGPEYEPEENENQPEAQTPQQNNAPQKAQGNRTPTQKTPVNQRPKTEINKLQTSNNQPEMPQMPGGMDMSAIMGMMGGQNGQGQQGGAPDMSAIMGMMGGQNGQGQQGGMDMSAIMNMMGAQNGQGGNIDISKMLPPGTQLPEGTKLPDNISMPDMSSVMNGSGMPDLSKIMPAGMELPGGMDINSIMNMNPEQLKQLGIPEDKIPEITQAKQQAANVQNIQQNIAGNGGGFKPKDLESMTQKPTTRTPTQINKLNP